MLDWFSVLLQAYPWTICICFIYWEVHGIPQLTSSAEKVLKKKLCKTLFELWTDFSLFMAPKTAVYLSTKSVYHSLPALLKQNLCQEVKCKSVEPWNIGSIFCIAGSWSSKQNGQWNVRLLDDLLGGIQ